MTPKERRTIILILAGSLLAGIIVAVQSADLQRKFTLGAGAVVLPLVVLRTGILAWEAFAKRRFPLAVLMTLLTGVLFLGMLGEWGKLVALCTAG